MVVSGFEPLDVLQSIWMVLRQIAEGRAEVENQYARVVSAGGNAAALRAIETVYELREFFEWRGLGSIDFSGVRFRKAYERFDAECRFAVPNVQIADLNSLNATLAVIKWKKLCGVYQDLEGEHHSTYSTNVNALTSDESPS